MIGEDFSGCTVVIVNATARRFGVCRLPAHFLSNPPPKRAKIGFFQWFSEAKSQHAGEFGGKKFCTVVDSKQVRNNLQGFEGKFTPLARGGGGTQRGYKPGGYLTDWLMRLGVHFFYLQVCANGG
jgi:hypothetical protein